MVDLENVHSFKVKVVTAKETYEQELLTPDNLRRFDMQPSDITMVSPNYAVPGYLYEEVNVASATHPCAGSACAVFPDPYGRICSIDYIAYHDSNPFKKHAGGKEHWNGEVRFVRDGEIINKIRPDDGHILEDTPEIEIISICDGIVNRQNVLRDQPIQ
jgi:hypothetical protein